MGRKSLGMSGFISVTSGVVKSVTSGVVKEGCNLLGLAPFGFHFF
jgi:hypothetical protein